MTDVLFSNYDFAFEIVLGVRRERVRYFTRLHSKRYRKMRKGSSLEGLITAFPEVKATENGRFCRTGTISVDCVPAGK